MEINYQQLDELSSKTFPSLQQIVWLRQKKKKKKKKKKKQKNIDFGFIISNFGLTINNFHNYMDGNYSMERIFFLIMRGDKMSQYLAIFRYFTPF